MIIRFGDLESDQPTLKGEVGIDIFQIENDGDVRSIGPINCELTTSFSGDHLIVDGTLSAPSLLRCVGCLEEFLYLPELSDYHAEIEIDDDSVLDLTEHIRDDILLKIPTYPRCTDGSQADRTCAMNGPFSYESKGDAPTSNEAEKTQTTDVWDALENLDTRDH